MNCVETLCLVDIGCFIDCLIPKGTPDDQATYLNCGG
jgi:hypothetical protein